MAPTKRRHAEPEPHSGSSIEPPRGRAEAPGRGDLARENEALRERISPLSSAILRINASLDLATVLHEVMEGARALTGARYSVITTIDRTGEIEDFASSGFTPDEHRRVASWPDGPRLFEHLRDLPQPLRHADLSAYAAALGYAPNPLPSTAFQGTPMRFRGVLVGTFFLAEKEGDRGFTDEDEEVLVLFASQAAAAIVNARTHRDEQRARADLEALVETSPVGVVVFDARSGRPASFNREARRIVEHLRTPDRPVEELADVITCRRADGREVALAEFPLVRQLGSAETVRSEELVLSVPGGRSVRTLINATPIRSEDGTVASVVVTMQDLAPLDELERVRAEFLDMVSHELRAPLTSIKGSTATVLGASPALDPAEMLQFCRIIDEQADHMRRIIGDLLDAGRIETGMLSVSPEPSEVVELVDQARNTFLSGGGRHRVVIDLPPELPRVMADRRRTVQVLNNLLSNAAARSPVSSPIRVAALRDGVQVAISVADEGRGVPPERLPHLFSKYARAHDRDRAPGSTGGFDLSLSICKGLVEAHGGRIRADSGGNGQGTRFTFTIPAVEEAADALFRGRRRRSRPRTGPDRERILVVDDDPQTLRYVRGALESAGYEPVVTGDHRELPALISTKKPRLVLLDLMLAGADGVELMEQVPELADQPVVFISAYGREETITHALDAGAADYIVKPFSPTELIARVRAALRGRAAPESFVLGDLTISYETRRVTVAGRPVRLTATEYELLRVLSLDAGRVATFDTLLRRVWGGRDVNDATVVRAFVRNLRRKLGDDAARPAYILSERGVGYRMAERDDAAVP